MTALSIQQLNKTYTNGFNALKNICIDVNQGDFFALLGPNGAGKSTMIGIIASLITKTSGSIKIFGIDHEQYSEKAKSFIGLVPQEFNFNVFEPVEEIIINQAGFYGIPRSQGKQRANELLSRLGLLEKRRQMARELSGGMKRRLMIARALVHKPKLLILDEPSAGVDIEIRRSMWDFLREINQQETTIILTTHYLEEAENLCRNIAIINNGMIIKHDSMKNFLAKMDKQTFILDLNEPLLTPLSIAPYKFKLLDKLTLEVEAPRGQGLNQLFNQLANCNVQVQSLRNKSNRLEELFLNSVQTNDAE